MSRAARTTGALISALRPRAWTKNLFVPAALIFSRRWEPEAILWTAAATAGFCLLSSSIYLINDIVDREKDRLHPEKRARAIASGALPAGTAAVAAALMSLTVLALSALLARRFLIAAGAYLASHIAYSMGLRRVVILDVLLIAMGFVLRAMAGVAVLQDAGYEMFISPWLLICTFFLAIFLAFSKRRSEVVLLGEGASRHRESLREYSPQLLDEMISIATAASVLGYSIYTVSERTVSMVSGNLYITIPFVAFGVFRYLYLVHEKGQGGSPEKLLLKDFPLFLNILLWLASVLLVLILFPAQ
ncbi:decaprenyl-phosphate phosphoribosyltransferase [Candidatus Fermentibacterales bacterium]|nr:decaprenyl-phosphate phosphoribosyltransferase [Candidatus Fermentibacterales bacterium]